MNTLVRATVLVLLSLYSLIKHTHTHKGVEVPQAERMMLTVAEIVKLLIQAQDEGRDVNLNKCVVLYIHVIYSHYHLIEDISTLLL